MPSRYGFETPEERSEREAAIERRRAALAEQQLDEINRDPDLRVLEATYGAISDTVNDVVADWLASQNMSPTITVVPPNRSEVIRNPRSEWASYRWQFGVAASPGRPAPIALTSKPIVITTLERAAGRLFKQRVERATRVVTLQFRCDMDDLAAVIKDLVPCPIEIEPRPDPNYFPSASEQYPAG